MRLPNLAPAALAVIALTSACAPHRGGTAGHPYVPPGFPNSIAVLPLANETLSMEGPKILRVRLKRQMRARGYASQKLGDTDVALRSIGVTLGGQIPATPYQELHQALGVDAVLSGRVIKYSAVVTGLVNTRTVEAEVVLTDLRTGHVLWHARDKVVHVEEMVSSAVQGGKASAALCLIGGVIGLFSGAAQHDMREESAQVSAAICRNAPLAGPPMSAVVAAAAASETRAAALDDAATGPATAAPMKDRAQEPHRGDLNPSVAFRYPSGIVASAAAAAIAPAGVGPVAHEEPKSPDPKDSKKAQPKEVKK